MTNGLGWDFGSDKGSEVTAEEEVRHRQRSKSPAASPLRISSLQLKQRAAAWACVTSNALSSSTRICCGFGKLIMLVRRRLVGV